MQYFKMNSIETSRNRVITKGILFHAAFYNGRFRWNICIWIPDKTQSRNAINQIKIVFTLFVYLSFLGI